MCKRITPSNTHARARTHVQTLALKTTIIHYMNHYKEIIMLWKLVVERRPECPLPVIGPNWESWLADDVLLGLIRNFCSFTQFVDDIAKTSLRSQCAQEQRGTCSEFPDGSEHPFGVNLFLEANLLTTLTTVGLADRSWTQLWRFELFCVYARANLTLVSQCVCVHQLVVLFCSCFLLSFFLLHNTIVNTVLRPRTVNRSF